MKTATKFVELNVNFAAGENQVVYKLSEPHCGATYVLVSAINGDTPVGPCHETYIFPCDEEGVVLDWAELPGSLENTVSHEAALNAAGYTIIKGEA